MVSHGQSVVGSLLSAFPALQYVHAVHATVLGSPLGSGAVRTCIEE